jgi:hypothetical protein
MSNTHEYVIFDRAKLDPALALKWAAFERSYPSWGQWASARDFLVEWGLGESQVDRVDEILARQTVRGTLLLSDAPGNPFTIFTVSTLTRTTCPTSFTMYSGSSSRFGSLTMPLRGSA